MAKPMITRVRSTEYTLVITASPATLCITITLSPGVQAAPKRKPELLVVTRSSPFFSPLVM